MSLFAKPNDIYQADILYLPHDRYEKKVYKYVYKEYHKSDIRLENKSNGMVRYFSKCGINNVMPNILEKVRSRDHYIRKAREQYYIELLEPQINAQ